MTKSEAMLLIRSQFDRIEVHANRARAFVYLSCDFMT